GGATFDQARAKVIAGENKDGKIDLTCQPVGPFLGPATADLWIPASQAGVPAGLFQASGYLSPRVGFAWRALGGNDLVVRGAWGMFTSSYQGNYTGSSIIGPPYWPTIAFAKASNQQWDNRVLRGQSPLSSDHERVAERASAGDLRELAE